MAALTTPQLVDEIGISYRVIDYWIRMDAIAPTVPANGSGSSRLFSDEDVFRLRFISRFYHLMPRLFNVDFVRQVWYGGTNMNEYDTHYELELEAGIVLCVPKQYNK